MNGQLGFGEGRSSGYCRSKNGTMSARTWHLIAVTFKRHVDRDALLVQATAQHGREFQFYCSNQSCQQPLASTERGSNRGSQQYNLCNAETCRGLRVAWKKGMLRYAPKPQNNGFVILHKSEGCRQLWDDTSAKLSVVVSQNSDRTCPIAYTFGMHMGRDVGGRGGGRKDGKGRTLHALKSLSGAVVQLTDVANMPTESARKMLWGTGWAFAPTLLFCFCKKIPKPKPARRVTIIIGMRLSNNPSSLFVHQPYQWDRF